MTVYPHPEEFSYTQGSYFVAEWYYTENGKMPALEYYNGLPEVDQLKMDAMVTLFCNTRPGEHLPQTYYRLEDPVHKIYAFKPRDERFFNFLAHGRKVIITNAYHKHSQEMTKKDLEHLKTAARHREDYLRRVKGGTYYEDPD